MTSPRRPLLAAGSILALQAVGVLAAGIAVLVNALTGTPHNQFTAVVLGIVTVLFAAGIAVAARGLLQGRHWATTPTWMTEFFAFVVGVAQLQSGASYPAVWIALVVTSILIVGATLLPAARETLLRG